MAFNTQIILPDSVIVLDAVESIKPTYPSRATQYPIESGASESDHIINDNMTLDIEAVVTNSASLFGFVLTQTTIKEALQSLKKAREERRTVQVVAKLDTYENMAITSFSFPEDSETGEALDIVINFEQITIASASFVTEQPVSFSDGISDDATSSESLGSQSTQTVDSDTLTSSLSELTSGIFSDG